MVVLDADSVSGDCLTGLVRLMEANPNAGIIQSSPKASGMDTLYARCQQFATRVFTGCSPRVCTSGSWVNHTTGATTRLSA
jgi:membrane glycosyltransferase